MSVLRRIIVFGVLFGVLFFGYLSYQEPIYTPEKQDQRAILNAGYSILYSNLSTLSKGKWVLLFKSESDSLKQVVNEVSEYAGAFRDTLKRISRDYPAVDIKLDPLPIMEQRTRTALMKSRVLTFAPFVGLKGMAFERRMLQSLEGPLNHLHFLCKVMADEESEPELNRVLLEGKDRLDALRKRVAHLLNERYYRDKPWNGEDKE